MDDTETEARIAELKPGIHYRFGTCQVYRACPADFRETFLRLGWDKALREHYRTNDRCIRRWIDDCGGDQLIADRCAITGMKPRLALRSRLPTYAEAVAAVQARGGAIRS